MVDKCNNGCRLVQLIKSYLFDICVLCSISIFLLFIFYLEVGANSLAIGWDIQ